MTGKATGNSQTLSDFAQTYQGRATRKAWFENLPQEVQDQLVAGWDKGLGGTVLLDWLKSIGYADATAGRVDGWLREHRTRG